MFRANPSGNWRTENIIELSLRNLCHKELRNMIVEMEMT